MVTKRPRSIRELVAEAHNYEYSTSVPLRVYLRAAETLSRHAELYKAQDAYSDAYILYLRFLDLLTNKISKNPQLKKGTDQYKLYLSLLSAKASSALENAEKIKQRLAEDIHEFERHHKIKQQQSEFSSKESLPETIPIDHDDFDEENFGNRLKQFQTYQKNNITKQSIESYPTLEHTSPQALSTLISQPQQSKSQLEAIRAPIPPPKISIPEEPAPQHKAIAKTEGNKPLKTVFLPSKLPLQFLQISSMNSKNNLETCGILCGSLSLNAFFITTLVIPSQESTSNTCQTLHEEDIFEYIDSKDLFVLGWIHTHPSQSCFLSSVDLHTQNSYQIMLPEALAIVCAVKYGEVGQFRLTDPPGIGIITKCQRSGFHPHEEKGIYKHCESKYGGHVVVRDGLPFNIVDLRKK